MSLKRKKIETLDDEENQQQLTKDEELAQKKTTNNNNNISFPIEIIQEILSRLPVKPLLQFRSVSKPWLSLISDDPSFSKLHSTRSTTTPTPFFISAYDSATKEIHFLSAPHVGGPVTHLITLRNYRKVVNETIKAEHLNGLVLFTSVFGIFGENFPSVILNPATRKVFKLSHPPNSRYFNCFFGFDVSKNEHIIFSIGRIFKPSNTIEFMIFSLSNYSWRKIHVEEDEKEALPPFFDIRAIKYCVCVNSVIHFMLEGRNKLLAFDLTVEKFSIINLPEGVRHHESVTFFTRKGKCTVKCNYPFLMIVNGLLGVVCYDHVTETNEMHIWILQDYVNRVWVKETIMFPESWIESDGRKRIDNRFMGNIVLSLRRLFRDRISAAILDMNTRSFKLVNFTLSHQFLHSKTLSFDQVGSYVESLLPLRER